MFYGSKNEHNQYFEDIFEVKSNNSLAFLISKTDNRLDMKKMTLWTMELLN